MTACTPSRQAPCQLQPPPDAAAAATHRRGAFTLVELLVVVAITAILLSIITPALSGALARGRSAKCTANLRQLYYANFMYAQDHGTYVAAAADVHHQNLQRWHGRRSKPGEPFDGSKGPLEPYLGEGGLVRTCPSFQRFMRNQPGANTFESSCGGYGYNQLGPGSLTAWKGYTAAAAIQGMDPSALSRASQTVMFTDTAFPQPYNKPDYLIEYSFAEAPFFLTGKPPTTSTRMARPSLHFRHHRNTVNVAWCDGHLTSEKMADWSPEVHRDFLVGWFGPRDNSLFLP